MKKLGINSQLRNKLFLIVIYRFSLVKPPMNAARVCKLRNGVDKTPQFLLSIANGGTKTFRASLFNEDLSNEPNFGRNTDISQK